MILLSLLSLSTLTSTEDLSRSRRYESTVEPVTTTAFLFASNATVLARRSFSATGPLK